MISDKPADDLTAERERQERAAKFAEQFCEKANNECGDYEVYMDQHMEALLVTEAAAFAASEVQLAMAQAVAEEQEACAKLAEDPALIELGWAVPTKRMIAAAIRERKGR